MVKIGKCFEEKPIVHRCERSCTFTKLTSDTGDNIMLSNDSEHVLKVSSCSDEWVASTVPDRSFVDGKFSAIELDCIFFGIPRALSMELNLGGLISIGKLRSSCLGRRMIDLHGGLLKHSMSTLKLNKMRRLYMYKYQRPKI